jgi:hypothetical protein
MGQDAAITSALPTDTRLPDDPETLKRMILELLGQLRDERNRRSGVEQRLDQLLRRLYGPKGEKFRPDQPSLLTLLGEVDEPEPPPLPPTLPAELEPEPPPRKKGHGRRKLPDDLVRERVVHDVSEADKVCPCCQTPRVKIGEETSEQLDYRPAKLFVWEHVRLKYACPRCAKAAATPLASFADVESATSPHSWHHPASKLWWRPSLQPL